MLTMFYASSQAANPFLQTLVNTTGGVVIAYGTDPKSLEAGNVIRDAIRAIPGQSAWNNMSAAASFDAVGFAVTGQMHIIAVGMLGDNVVLQNRNWLPTMWLDRDWYYNSYQYKLTPAQTGLSYQPTTGFMAAGYGEWPHGSAVGYVEVDRSDYFMEWMVMTRWQAHAGGPIQSVSPFAAQQASYALKNNVTPTYPKDYPLRLVVRVTGGTGDGVIAAAHAFAERNMLAGMTLNGIAADNAPAMFTLPQSRYYTSLPFTPPEVTGLTYQGWLLADAFDYDGFRAEARVSPQVMYRIKYKPSFGITNFWTSPARKATQFEICAVKFASGTDASSALANLDAAIKARGPYKAGIITGFNYAAVGSIVYMESMPEPGGGALLTAYKNLAAW